MSIYVYYANDYECSGFVEVRNSLTNPSNFINLRTPCTKMLLNQPMRKIVFEFVREIVLIFLKFASCSVYTIIMQKFYRQGNNFVVISSTTCFDQNGSFSGATSLSYTITKL
jgi:hypothetical protein